MKGPERRVVRIPFVRPCSLELDDGTKAGACLVNLSVQGAYVSHLDPFGSAGRAAPLPAHLPRLGQAMRISFVPREGTEPVLALGRVSWLNPGQQHPVHSLPPGFGLQFQPLGDAERAVIQAAVEAWQKANPQAR